MALSRSPVSSSTVSFPRLTRSSHLNAACSIDGTRRANSRDTRTAVDRTRFSTLSGFSDMAVGVSRLLGFQLYDNFDRPLLATSPLRFWQGWHVSAYRWLMTHVFYPSWEHRQVLLKIQTTFLASVAWHFSIAQRHDADAAVQLLCAGALYGFGVWAVAAVGRRRAAGTAPMERGPASRLLRRIAATAATFVFISFVHLVFRAGLSGRPLHSTWSDLTVLLGPTVEAEPAGTYLDRDRVDEMIPNLEVEDMDGRRVRLAQLMGPRGLVVAMRDVSCPVAKRYGPRLARLETAYTPRGVAFAFLNPTRHDTRQRSSAAAACRAALLAGRGKRVEKPAAGLRRPPVFYLRAGRDDGCNRERPGRRLSASARECSLSSVQSKDGSDDTEHSSDHTEHSSEPKLHVG